MSKKIALDQEKRAAARVDAKLKAQEEAAAEAAAREKAEATELEKAAAEAKAKAEKQKAKEEAAAEAAAREEAEAAAREKAAAEAKARAEKEKAKEKTGFSLPFFSSKGKDKEKQKQETSAAEAEAIAKGPWLFVKPTEEQAKFRPQQEQAKVQQYEQEAKVQQLEQEFQEQIKDAVKIFVDKAEGLTNQAIESTRDPKNQAALQKATQDAVAKIQAVAQDVATAARDPDLRRQLKETVDQVFLAWQNAIRQILDMIQVSSARQLPPPQDPEPRTEKKKSAEPPKEKKISADTDAAIIDVPAERLEQDPVAAAEAEVAAARAEVEAAQRAVEADKEAKANAEKKKGQGEGCIFFTFFQFER